MQLHKNAVKLARLLGTPGLASAMPNPGMAQEPRRGEIRIQEYMLAWDRDASAWLSPEQFWLNYAGSRGAPAGSGDSLLNSSCAGASP